MQAKIVRSPVNPETFLNILEKIEVYREEMMDSLLREIEENEFQRKQVSSAKLDTVRIFFNGIHRYFGNLNGGFMLAFLNK